MRSCGMALVPAGQAPLLSGNTTWVRWLALSMFLPSQQLAKSSTRCSGLPRGQIGYLVVNRLVKPVQVHFALPLAPPLIAAFASPVMSRMNVGIATTLDCALPRKRMLADVGRMGVPTLCGFSASPLA